MKRSWLGLLCAAAVLFGGAPAAAAERGPTTLVLARVSSDIRSTIAKMQPLGAYLAEALAPYGVSGHRISVAATLEELAAALDAGRAHFVSETPLGAVALMRKGNAVPVAREWKKGVAAYHGVFFARADGGIHALADLAGKKVAFEDPGSTTGFFVPYAALLEAGLDPIELPSIAAPVPAGRVGYLFSDGEMNSVAWVERGLVAAGAFSNLDWEDVGRAPETLRGDLRLFHATRPLVRSLALVSDELPPTVRQALTRTLLTMHATPAGAAAMKRYNKIKRYDALEGEAATMMREAEAIYERIADRLP